jgi:hypothetical protein
MTKLLPLLLITIMIIVNQSLQSADAQKYIINDNNKSKLDDMTNNLSDNIGDSVYPQIAAYGNNVYVVWQDNNFSNNYKNYDILYKRTTDGGTSFKKIINLSNNNGFSEHPQIAAYGNNVYVVWADDTFMNREILLSKGIDDGSSFGNIVNISGNLGDSFNQEIAAYGNNVYVVWVDSSSDGKSSILFKASTNGGLSFGDTKIVSTNAGISYPKVAAYENNVYVVWNMKNAKTVNDKNNNGIFFTKSSDNGNTFENIMKLNNGKDFGESQIAVSENNIYVAWSSSSSSSSPLTSPQSSSSPSNIVKSDGIFFTKSSDNGNTFENELLFADNLKNPRNIEMLTYKENVYVVWQTSVLSENDNEEILIKRSQDIGNTFGTIKNISNNEGISECPSIAISQNNIYVVWQDDTSQNKEILLSTKI